MAVLQGVCNGQFVAEAAEAVCRMTRKMLDSASTVPSEGFIVVPPRRTLRKPVANTAAPTAIPHEEIEISNAHLWLGAPSAHRTGMLGPDIRRGGLLVAAAPRRRAA